MTPNRKTVEASEMKPLERRWAGRNRFALLVVFCVVLTTAPAVVLANTLIHNSTTLGSIKWQVEGGWGVAGGKYGAFTCATCHGRNTGNIKRVKATMTTPDGSNWEGPGSPNVTVNFQSTSGANSFGDDGRATLTSSSMVCEACHSQTAVHRYDSSAISDFNHKNANQTDCMVCHPHNVGFTPLACDSCHGYPPTTNDNDGSSGTGLAFDPVTTGSNTAGAHAKHAVDLGYSCDNCHLGYVMPNNGDIDIHFANFGSTSGTYTGQLGVSYNSAAGTGGLTCNAVYCHSNGQSADGLSVIPVYSAPSWTGTALCGSCHSATDPATGSHTAHINDGATCAACHAANVHVNRLIDVTAGVAYSAGGAPGNGYGTCATASCHNDGRNNGLTAAWGTQRNNCSECHATVPATGGHTAHVGVKFAGAAIGCGDCHTGAQQGTTAPTANHRDGNVNALGYPVQAIGSAFTTCSTAACHQTGQLANDYVVTPLWDADTANCTQCHAAAPTTGSHTKHIATTGDCSSCHTEAVINVSYNSAKHGDLNIDVAVGGYNAIKIYNSAYLSCSAVSCHSDGMTATGDSPVWGDASAGCAACHLSDMATGSHTIHLADGASCGDCHGDAIKDSAAPTDVHTNNNVDVYNSAVGDLGYPQTAAYGIASWSTCTAASCHDDGTGTPGVTPTWGTPNNDCSACHATIPATGSHAQHVTSTAYAKAVCGDCHAGAVQGSNAGTGPHRDGNLDVLNGYPLLVAKGGAPYDTCTTAYCHSSGQSLSNGASAVPIYATVTWGGTAACGSCHAVAGLTSGSHAAHIGATGVNGCGDCHAGAANDASVYNSAIHVDGAINVTGTYTAAGTPGNGYGTCSTAACHDNGTGTLVATPTWGNANNDCSACHATIPATGSHVKHVTTQAISAAIGCGDCHGTAVQGTTAPADHLDGNLDVYNSAGLDLGYPLIVAKGGAPYDTCSTAYCHSNGKGTFQTITWGATLTGCASCHGYPPAGGHPSSSDCQACHTNVNATNNGFVDINLHIDGSVQAEGGSCSSCHGYPPVPGDGKTAQGVEGKGAHEKHVIHIAARASVTLNADTDTFTGANSAAVCGVCHDVSSDTNHSMSGGTRELLIPTSYQFGASAPAFNGTVGISSSTDPKSCSNASCHFRETPIWAPVGGE